jgi:hypothetical protein
MRTTTLSLRTRKCPKCQTTRRVNGKCLYCLTEKLSIKYKVGNYKWFLFRWKLFIDFLWWRIVGIQEGVEPIASKEKEMFKLYTNRPISIYRGGPHGKAYSTGLIKVKRIINEIDRAARKQYARTINNDNSDSKN